MIIIVKTAVTFKLPKEKELMEEFERDNPDWVLSTQITNTATYRRTQIFEVGAKEE